VTDILASGWFRNSQGMGLCTSNRRNLKVIYLYLESESLLNNVRIELLNHKQLFAELRGLERRTRSGGRDVVDHPRSAKDDAANCVAGVCVLLSGVGKRWTRIRLIGTGVPKRVEVSPEVIERDGLIPVYDHTGRLSGYVPQYEPGGEARASLEAVHDGSGEVIRYQRVKRSRLSSLMATPVGGNRA